MGREAVPRFRCVVPVWGSYVDTFLDVSMPSLMQSHNVPTLCRRGEMRLEIFTRPEDVSRLRGGLELLLGAAGCELEVIALEIDASERYSAMTACHRAALERAEPGDRFFVINADLVLCDGALARAADWADAGYRALLVPGLRLDLERARKPLIELLRDAVGQGVTSRELVCAGLPFLHPTISRHLGSGSSDELQIPAVCAWKVGDDGYLLRCFHLHPLMLVLGDRLPRLEATIDDAFVWDVCDSPEQVLVARDSDEIALFELSSPTHSGGSTVPRDSILAFANWIRRATSRRQRELALQALRVHCGAGDAGWSRAQQMSLDMLSRRLRAAERLPVSLPFSWAGRLGRVECWLRRLWGEHGQDPG